MAIQMRRGLSTDFNPDKMVPGEWAVSQDNQKLYMCFTSGHVVEMGSIVSGYGYIRYSEHADGTDFVTVPTTATIYIGFYMGNSVTAPVDKTAYTWVRYRGDTGNGISQISKVSTVGSVDTYEVLYTDGNKDYFTVTNGTGNNIYWTSVMTSTSTTTAQTYPSSGITTALVGDMAVNSSTWNVYKCTSQGGPSIAEWLYVGNIQGASGSGSGDMTYADYDPSPDFIVRNAGGISPYVESKVDKWLMSGSSIQVVTLHAGVDVPCTFTGLDPAKTYALYVETADGTTVKAKDRVCDDTLHTVTYTISKVTTSQAGTNECTAKLRIIN